MILLLSICSESCAHAQLITFARDLSYDQLSTESKGGKDKHCTLSQGDQGEHSSPFHRKKLSLTFPVARIKADVLKECPTWLIAKQLTNTVGSEDTKKCRGYQSTV